MKRFEIVEKYKDILDDSYIPSRTTHKSAGYDLRSAENIIIPPIWSFHDRMIDVLQRDLQAEDFDMALDLDEVEEKLNYFGIKPTLVSTGLKCYMEDDEFLGVYSRSSGSYKYLLSIANGVGIIDADYVDNPNNEGEIFVQLINLSPFAIEIKKGDKIGQGIFHKYGYVEDDANKDKETRIGGFGSTDNR